VRILYKGRNKLAHLVFRGYDDGICNRVKGRKIHRSTDIWGVFLHADMDEDIHMMLERRIAKLIVKLEPKLYSKYVLKNKYI